MKNNDVTIEEIDIKIREFSEQANKMRQELEKLNENINNLRDEKSNLLFGDFEISLEKIMGIEDWTIVANSAYFKIKKYLEKEHSYISFSGYNSKTLQISLTLSKYNNPGQDFNKIEYILSLIRPVNDKKYIHIMDSSCSAGGVWTLVNGTIIERTLWGITRVEKEFETIKEALMWIYDNLFNEESVDD